MGAEVVPDSARGGVPRPAGGRDFAVTASWGMGNFPLPSPARPWSPGERFLPPLLRGLPSSASSSSSKRSSFPLHFLFPSSKAISVFGPGSSTGAITLTSEPKPSKAWTQPRNPWFLAAQPRSFLEGGPSSSASPACNLPTSGSALIFMSAISRRWISSTFRHTLPAPPSIAGVGHSTCATCW